MYGSIVLHCFIYQRHLTDDVCTDMLNLFKHYYTVTLVPVFSGLCDQRTPAVSGQYNDVRCDFLYKLPRDQRTPANADADRHFVVIFAPQPADSALFILFC